MKGNDMSYSSIKLLLLRSTILAGATVAAAAAAQGVPGPAVADAEREITVTGTLIKNPNLVRSTPVIATTAEEIELKQSNVAEDVLREIPGVVPSIGSAVNNGNGGASYVDLRGLGSFRNIVLLDGSRIVPAGLFGRVDLNNIPLALVDRVEALTGGASTTYGADAVTGVVNFITRQNFTGIDLSGSEQITERGDGNYYRTDLTIGGNFADDKGNAVLSVGYQHADPVYQGDRAFATQNISSFSGKASGSGTSVPSRFSGTRPIDPVTGLPSVDPAVGNGGVRQLDPVTGAAVPTFFRFNFNPFNIFQTPFKRFNIFAQATYDVSDDFTVYSRGLFSKNTVNTIVAPSGSFGTAVDIPLSNPFLPATLHRQFCAFNVATADGVYTPQFTPAECTAAATATSPTDPAYRTVTTTLSRRTSEVGPRISEYTTTIFDYRIGARGKIGEHLSWDVNAAYGESENLAVIKNFTLASRFRQALLATNPTTCLDPTNGCVPLNVFGPNGSITPAQAAFLTADSTTRIKTQLGQVHAQLSGDVNVTSPAATDPVSFAVGAEYRKYKAIQASDTLAKTAGELGGAAGAAPDIDGGYNVIEGFGELVVPLVQDKPGFDSLTVEAGIRYSAYKVDGGLNAYNTTTYKGGATWAPGGGVKFRGNYSRAVRAPTIAELFNPVTTGLTNLSTDPCAGDAPVANANLRAVCLAQGAPVGTIGNILDPTAGQANQTGGGNINSRPEIADTYTGGIVFAPKAVPGLSLTLDYYKIVVNRAISSPLPGDVVDGCFKTLSAASATSPACLGIRRNPVTGGLDGDPATTLGLPIPLSNAGRLRTDGLDFAASYSHDLGFAKLGVGFTGNYTFHAKFQAVAFPTPTLPRTVDRECAGRFSTNCSFTGSLQPKWQTTMRTTLGFDAIDVSLLWRHIDAMNQEPLDITGAFGNGPAFKGVSPVDGTTVNYGHIRPYDYFDLSTRVALMENLSLTLTASNIFDVKPPPVGSTIGAAGFNSGNTYPSTYDALGRRFAVTARVRF